MRRAFNVFLMLILSVFHLSTSFALFLFLILFKVVSVFRLKVGERMSLLIKRLWLRATIIVMSFYFYKPVLIIYDPAVLDAKRCIALSNHQTMYDWWYFLVVLYSLGKYDDLVIVLKESISKIPMYGYAMRSFGFIFLSRNLSVDRKVLDRSISKLKERIGYFLLLFPEGTIIDKETHEKSLRYSIENNVCLDGIPFIPQRVLVPRKTGFKIALDKLKDNVEGIVDITIFTGTQELYPQDDCTFFNIFISRKKVFRLNFVIDFHSINTDVLEDEWIYRAFRAKDEVLMTIERISLGSKNKDIRAYEADFIRRLVDTGPNSRFYLKTINLWSNYYYAVVLLFYIMALLIACTFIKIR